MVKRLPTYRRTAAKLPEIEQPKLFWAEILPRTSSRLTFISNII
jgi:hypothetical protein